MNHRMLMIVLLLGMVCAVADDDDPLLRKRRSKTTASPPSKAIEHTTTATLQHVEMVFEKPDPLSRGGGIIGALRRVAEEIANLGKGSNVTRAVWSLTITPKLERDERRHTGKVTLRVTEKDWQLDSNMPSEPAMACAADRVTATANLKTWSAPLSKEQLNTLSYHCENVPL